MMLLYLPLTPAISMVVTVKFLQLDAPAAQLYMLAWTLVDNVGLSSVNEASTTNAVSLEFDSIVDADFSFNSSGAIISAITDALADFSAAEINKKGDAYDTFTSNINDQLLSVANNYIDSKLKPSFGASCVSA
ncbi:unnamed protein product [Phytophthora lilii]|uniref:Unnamed protein product n=1 Tax=Phytophthora lilii TaxID=2077276 RepID=A0A9W6WRX5_9STRA|nr:unnamed protein product [Phytophthora lilii]